MAEPGGMTEEQLKIEERFNEILRERIKLRAQQSSAEGEAASVSQQLNNATKTAAEDQGQIKDAVAGVTEAMRAQTGGASELSAALGRGAAAGGPVWPRGLRSDEQHQHQRRSVPCSVRLRLHAFVEDRSRRAGGGRSDRPAGLERFCVGSRGKPIR